MPWSLFVPDLIMFIHHFTCPPYTVDHLICHTLRPHTEGTQRPHLEAIMELHFEPRGTSQQVKTEAIICGAAASHELYTHSQGCCYLSFRFGVTDTTKYFSTASLT